jgi:hypothetical protein
MADTITPAEWRFVEAIANSDAVLHVYAAPEFDELSGDGKCWLAAIVRETARTCAFLDAIAALGARMEELKDVQGSGFWRSCTGCHETNEGYPVGSYPYSPGLKCHLGIGCNECGGVGAVWDNTDYGEFAEFSIAADRDHDNIKRILIDGGIQPYPADQLAMAITALEIPAALIPPAKEAAHG